MKRISLVLLCLVLSLSLFSGCAEDITWSHSHNGEQIPAGLYIFFQLFAASEALSFAANEGNLPQNMTALTRLSIEGQNGADWINSKALEHVRRYFAALEYFSAMELEFTATMEAQADGIVNSMWADAGHVFEQNHISRSSVRLYAISIIKTQSVFEALFGEGGQREVPLEELRQEFAREYAYMQLYAAPVPMFAPEGLDISDEDFIEMVIMEFENLPSQLNSTGDNFAEVATEFEFWLADLYGADPYDVFPFSPEDLMTFIDRDERAEHPENFMHTVFTAPLGLAIAVEVPEYGLLVLFRRVDVFEEEWHFELYRDTLLLDLRGPDFEDELSAFAAMMTVRENRSALRSYRPARLTFEF
jgi:hypothetical protein